MPKVDSFLSIAENVLLFKSIKANAVERLLRNPNCFEILCKVKISVSRLNMTSQKAHKKLEELILANSY